jgi:hypothetical protein
LEHPTATIRERIINAISVKNNVFFPWITVHLLKKLIPLIPKVTLIFAPPGRDIIGNLPHSP